MSTLIDLVDACSPLAALMLALGIAAAAALALLFKPLLVGSARAIALAVKLAVKPGRPEGGLEY
ncbi:hypothetical protein ASF61_14810 [Duganella sp. Leaf126]|uniref:hypothetical protein n=1 Tax=Duganella sp. Leaf126 TaxID=1736266 RepID=UPI000702384B|nr:hypothetical protein [Duganella sp. Leaf126]KQQ32798.1 hypothetical protein ASF61_14810 [Duganella sp. Leaf126]